MIISKVISVEDAGKDPWESSHGLMYVFWVQLEDGTEGEVNAKDPKGPPYREGDLVGYEVKKEYKGIKTLRIDKQAAGGGRGGDRPPSRSSAPPSNSTPVAGQRRTNSDAPESVYGGTVGMALKEAIALHARDIPAGKVGDTVNSLPFLKAVHATASHIIRISLALEAARLVPSLNEKPKAPAAPEELARRPADPGGRGRDTQPNGGAAFPPGEGVDEDVPF